MPVSAILFAPGFHQLPCGWVERFKRNGLGPVKDHQGIHRCQRIDLGRQRMFLAARRAKCAPVINDLFQFRQGKVHASDCNPARLQDDCCPVAIRPFPGNGLKVVSRADRDQGDFRLERPSNGSFGREG
jgi:hypothetical protein